MPAPRDAEDGRRHDLADQPRDAAETRRDGEQRRRDGHPPGTGVAVLAGGVLHPPEDRERSPARPLLA